MRIRIYRILCALVLLGAFGAMPTALAEQNSPGFIANPGFESGKTTPDDWTFNQRGTTSEIAWDKARSHSGVASIRITNRDQTESGNVVQTIKLNSPLAPGSRITFHAMAATESPRRNGAKIVLYLQGESAERQTVWVSGPAVSSDFVPIGGEAIAERPTDRIVVYLCNYAEGTVWWDDFDLSVSRVARRPIRNGIGDDGALTLPPTDDGLQLAMTKSGGVDRVTIAGQVLEQSVVHSGLWLMPFGEDTVPVSGDLCLEENALRQSFTSDKAGLHVEAEYRTQGSVIECSGVVEATSATDRGVDVVFGIPVGLPDWLWSPSIRRDLPLSAGPHTQSSTTFASLSAPDSEQGLALAVPADAPCDCRFTYDAIFGFCVRFRFGLSHAAGGRLKGRAPFRFVLYRCNGRWRLRDAAARYYRLWPDAFTRRATKQGLWMFGTPRFPLPDPEDYTFHEGGPAGWEDDDTHGILTCPYIIPGQREITGLATLPEGQEQAMDVFRDFQPPDVLERPRPGWGSSIKEIVENCALYDAQGRPHVLVRNTDWGGNSVTFPLNASPHLHETDDHLTIAKTLLTYVEKMNEEIPSLDGIYVDSLGNWGNYLDYRRDHFRDATIPLSYDPLTGRPVIPNRFTLLEFLWALRDKLHADDKLLFANGLHPNRRFHFFALDVLGVEGHGDLEQKRVMAYQKPFLLLIYNIHDDPAQMEHYFHLCTFYGIYPSFANMRTYENVKMYEATAGLNRRFVPVLRKINDAGWQPVTHAHGSETTLWLERWGPNSDGQLYFTVYNPGKESCTSKIILPASPLGLHGESQQLTDLLSDDTWKARRFEDHYEVLLSIPAQQCRALLVESP